MWFKSWKLKTTTIIFWSFVWILYVSRLIWTCYEISRSNFILFVDREFIYLFTWSWIMVYPFRLNSWTFGGTLIRHWSINICFYRLPKFWMTYNFFLKNALIVCHLLIIWHLISIPKKKKKINSKNDKLTWKTDIINYHIKFILTQSHGPHPTRTYSRDKQHKSQKGWVIESVGQE